MPTEGLPDEYYLGLLDSLLRVRFHVRVDSDTQFRPQPLVRITSKGNDHLLALAGEFLEELEIEFELVAPEQGHDYFAIHRKANFTKLYDFVEGRSTQAVRELGFLTTTYDTEFSYRDYLTVDEMYQLAQTVDKLHYGRQSSGRPPLTNPEKLRENYDVADTRIEPLDIGIDGFRDDYPIEYVAGIVDALAIFRPSIGPSGYGVGYTMTPQIRMSRSGVHPAFALSVQQFCEQRGLPCTTDGEMHQLQTIIDGATAIDAFAPVIGPYLVAKSDELGYLHGELVPRFLEEEHHTKQGFYELVVDFEPLSTRGGVRQKRRKYTPEYFEDLWDDEIAVVD